MITYIVQTRANKGPIWKQEHEKLGSQHAQHSTRVPILFSETRPQAEKRAHQLLAVNGSLG